MTTRDIYNYVQFKKELEHLINDYIEKGIPATIILPIMIEAYNSVDVASKEEIKNAFAEIETEINQSTNENCDECEVK